MKTSASLTWVPSVPAAARAIRCRWNYPLAFLPGVFTLALAYPVWQKNGPVWGGAVGLLGVGSLLSCHWLVARIGRILSRQAELDERLRQSHKLAVMGELSAGIAHEINNPLAVIGQEAEWMGHLVNEMRASGDLRPDDLEESTREIQRQVGRCREIARNLLDFARKKDPLLQVGDLHELIEDMVKLVEKVNGRTGIRIVRDYCRDLPQVRTDHPLLKQVILNLLNNACHASEPGGSIAVRTAPAARTHVNIVVEDTGCGIAPEHLDKIFDPFFTTKPPEKGTGLGLFICQGIIERLGGEILVESELGKGTKFIIHLPVDCSKGEGGP